jgi:hypothetical protein
MNVWKLITGVALVLVVGILIGSVSTGFFVKQRHWPPPPPPMDPMGRTAFIVERLSKDLGLTETQKIAIEKIVSRTEGKLQERFTQERFEIDRIIEDSFLQMKKELNDSQKKKLNAAKERFDKNRPPRGGGPFGPPGPPPEGPGGAFGRGGPR